MTRHTELPATCRDHDPVTRTGSVLLDDGTLLPYSAKAFDGAGLLLLRSGQRVRIRLDATAEQPVVVAVTLATFALP
jgi:2-phospho-L-lactate guanylyltransferase